MLTIDPPPWSKYVEAFVVYVMPFVFTLFAYLAFRRKHKGMAVFYITCAAVTLTLLALTVLH